MLEGLVALLGSCVGLVCLALVVALVGFLGWRWWNARDDDPRLLADRAVPLRRWAQAVMGVYQGDCGDPGYWDAEQCRSIMTNGWSTPNRAELDALLDRYHRGESNVAFDKARIVWLARMGAGTGWLSEAESWDHVARAYVPLVAEVDGWDRFAALVREGVTGWYGGESKMPADRLENLDEAMAWGRAHHAKVPWRLPETSVR